MIFAKNVIMITNIAIDKAFIVMIWLINDLLLKCFIFSALMFVKAYKTKINSFG